MRLMVREKSFYRTFFAMFFVLVLQQVITLSVNLADNMMLGAYSESALSGVAAVNQIQFVYNQLVLAFADSIVILGGQYFGRKQYHTVKDISSMAMRFGLLLATILFVIITVMPARMMMIFSTDATIIHEGCSYLAIIRFTYFFFAVTQVLLATLRSTGVVKIALTLSISTLIINCCINYVLIYGHFGAPEMGAAGAAIGTLIARIVEVVILVIFIARQEKILLLKLKDYFGRHNRELFKDYVKLSLPMLFLNSLWGLNNAAQTAILGHMTARAIAANSVTSTLFLIVKSFSYGSAQTGGFIVAKTIGEGDAKRLQEYARTMQVIFVIVGILTGTLFFFLRIPVLSIYNLSEATKAMANQFLMFQALTMAFQSYQMPVNMGLIKGGGDIRYCTKLDLISIWCIVIPVSVLMAFVFHAPPLLVFFCLNSDQFFKGVPAYIKINHRVWAHKLTREEAV